MKDIESIESVAKEAVDYLYTLKTDKEISDELAGRIAALRQLINEEFVGKNRQVSSQLIYDMLKEAL